MSACADRELALSAYLDAELEPAAAGELEQHLAGCPDCRAELATLEAVGDAVRRAGPLAAEPTSLRRRFAASPAFRALAAAAVVLALAVGYGVGRGRDAAAARDAVTADLLSAHLRALLPGRLVDVESSDRHTVKPWFAGRIDFSPPVPDLAAQGFPLLGGRLDFVSGRRAAVLVYGLRLHRIDLFVLPAEPAPPGPRPARLGYNFLSWREGPLAYLAVSDVGAGDLRQFAALYRGAEISR